ncbi:hypothetical protein BCS71_16275 [Vibrio lentus]|uniref:hypothetical protein n=1 Tax=Vibrio TaxID=662 RepID=UPI00031C334A|nr:MULTISPECIES: hypothetical protein [Vibrio]OCH56292.1 hypothetical protein A6E08_03755 [Vibrio lentus]PMI61309.1 hypothetical protein BCU41_16795 [Vibrio lentus]
MKFQISIISVLVATLTACGGGGGGSTPPTQKKQTVVPQMSVTPAKGSVADPKDDAAKKFASRPAMYSENTIGSTDIKQCEKSLNLFKIYSIGWEDEFNKGLSAKQRKDLKDFRGIYLADGRVENIVNTKQTIEAKDWISYFYYDANFQDCEARRYKSYAKESKVGEDITELRYKYSVDADATTNTPQQNISNYTAWQTDSAKNTVIGLVTNITTGSIQHKQQLKSFKSDIGRSVDNVSFSKMFRNSYFLESYDNGKVEYQVVGGKVIDRYGKSKSSDPDTYYAINLISAYFPDVGTRINWCVRGSQLVSNQEKPISEAQYKRIIGDGDLGAAYCDPFDKNIGKVRYYDTKGNKVLDSSAIANELNNKLVQGTVIKDKLDQRVKNKKLYLGKTHSEYFQDTSLVNQVDQIKADLTQ